MELVDLEESKLIIGKYYVIYVHVGGPLVVNMILDLYFY